MLINLSSQFDASISGVYHVRIELAHPKVWSNWRDVDVPAVENPGSHGKARIRTQPPEPCALDITCAAPVADGGTDCGAVVLGRTEVAHAKRVCIG